MKTSNTSLPDRRKASPNCFNGLPGREDERSERQKPIRFGPFLPALKPGRFIDYAVDSVTQALAETLVTANAALPDDEWVAPLVQAELDAIFAMIMGGKTFDNEDFAEYLNWKHRELFVGVVNVDINTIDPVTVPPGVGFGTGPVTLDCHPMEVLACASSCAGKPAPKLPVFRWSRSTKHFSLPLGKRAPGTNYVCGPYLTVGIHEPSSLAVAKLRQWPVWFDAILKRMSIVRSNIERGSAAGAAASGAVACTLTGRAQLLLIQKGLGHRWPQGDLGTYPYHPDKALMPMPGCVPIVGEDFGVRSIKRYDVGKADKKEHGRLNQMIRFLAIEAPRLTEAGAYEQMAALVADPANGIWHQPPALRAAA